MRILMVTAELAPLAKVGGLADMTASLAAALGAAGHDVRIVLPLYGTIDRAGLRPLAKIPPFQVQVGQQLSCARWWWAPVGPQAPRAYFCECDGLFADGGIYGDTRGPVADPLARWALLARAALSLPLALGWEPHVLHGHDAAAALALVYHRRWCRATPGLAGTRSLLTIHNLGYQEIHPAARVADLGLPASEVAYPGDLEFWGRLNLLKGGILAADRVNTVSPAYAREIVQEPALAFGLDGVLRQRGVAFTGILNGADLAFWDPAADPHLPARYGPDDLAGKEACARAVAAELGLRGDGPLLGTVGRLAEQKGIDLLLGALPELLAAGARVAVQGAGEDRYRLALEAAAAAHPGRVAFAGRFDEGLAHRIIAGSDLFLMPSRYEPCGLTQMYALRYGSVPVARRTGGIADTIVDAAEPDGNGFLFEAAEPRALAAAVGRALALRADPELWGALRRRGMGRDFGWNGSARRYEELYESLATEGARR